MNTNSYWADSSSFPRFPAFKNELEVDVAIVGAGITGITAAYLFKKAGYRVALIERGRCGGFDTSNTTAHVTCVTDSRLSDLVSKFGKKSAKSIWDGGNAAFTQMEENVTAEKIKCEFVRVPGYYHLSDGPTEKKETDLLVREVVLANELGFPAQYVESVPLVKRPGIEFAGQAKFHPLKYLSALLRTIPGNGCHVFENSEVSEIESEAMTVKIGDHTVRCSYVVLATHNPLMGKSSLISATLFQTKLFLYTSYAIGARIPEGGAPAASFWDTDNPYHYLRVDKRRGYDYAIFGGEDHKTGQKDDTREPYQRLEKALLEKIPDAKIDHHWSGQVIETPDGLPYIGETAKNQFVATGFAGNGMTFGTLGAMMAVDSFLQKPNPWAKIFHVRRKHLLVGAGKYLKENKDYPALILQKWMGAGTDESIGKIKRNEGEVLKYRGQKVAVFRDARGKLFLHSPVCPHMQCIVRWNGVEKTWDCPCHGSRFTSTGEVLSGPAENGLERIEVD
jgi:glycine/D-amino acid oxidase-like deaminating enzyme/nitrite reductase/ring-hydroxylating ferredoxin subunit